MLGRVQQSLGLRLQVPGTVVKEPVKEEPEEQVEAQPLPGAAGRRRLRHVSQLALRGFAFSTWAASTGSGYTLELAVEGTGEVVERSSVWNTWNPTWAPVCGWQRGRQLNSFELRAVDAGSQEVIWRHTVHLADAEVLGEELEGLHSAVPLVTPLLQIKDPCAAPNGRPRWLAAVSRQVSASGGASASSPDWRLLESRRRQPAVKKIQASEICGAGDRISTLLGRLHKLQAESQALREDMAKALNSHQEFEDRRTHCLLVKQRAQQLRQAREERQRSLQRLRERRDSTLQRCRDRAAGQERGRAQRLEASQARLQLVATLQPTRVGLQRLWRQLRCRQMRMFHEVCQVYPIERNESCWSIRGINVVGIENLSRQDLREEESISSALGFLAHLLVTVAGILEVPLRITMQQAGCSRSFLIDPHEASSSGGNNGSATPKPSEWPLFYGRGLEKSRFETALRHLRDSLEQFLYSRACAKEKQQTCDGDLLACAALIIRHELYGRAEPSLGGVERLTEAAK